MYVTRIASPRLLVIIAIVLGLSCWTSATASAQATGSIRGHVVEARTGSALAAVLVQVESTRQRAISDTDGAFVIDNVPLGPQTVVVSVVGFGLVRREVVIAAEAPTDSRFR